jgi:hypothetical protein
LTRERFLGSGVILDYAGVNFPSSPFRIGRDFQLMLGNLFFK